MATQNSLNSTVGTATQIYTATTGSPSTFQDNAYSLIATVVLTSSQVKNLRATPIQIIAAPGSGKTIVVHMCFTALRYGGTNAFTGSQTVQLQYTNGSGTLCTVATPNTNLISNTSSVCAWGQGIYAAPGTAIASSTFENQAVVIHNAGAAEFAGNAANNNTVVISCFYSIITI